MSKLKVEPLDFEVNTPPVKHEWRAPLAVEGERKVDHFLRTTQYKWDNVQPMTKAPEMYPQVKQASTVYLCEELRRRFLSGDGINLIPRDLLYSLIENMEAESLNRLNPDHEG